MVGVAGNVLPFDDGTDDEDFIPTTPAPPVTTTLGPSTRHPSCTTTTIGTTTTAATTTTTTTMAPSTGQKYTPLYQIVSHKAWLIIDRSVNRLKRGHLRGSELIMLFLDCNFKELLLDVLIAQEKN